MTSKKRKIKMNPQISKGSKIVTPVVTKSPRKFKSYGYGKYHYPTYEQVPSGEYFSKIIHAEEAVTYTGKYAIEIFYEIRALHICYKIANGLMEDDGSDGIHFIKLKLNEASPYYQLFIDSMSEALECGDEGFELTDINGVTEHVKLAYNGDYADYIDRFPYEFEDYIDPKLHNENNNTDDDNCLDDEENDIDYLDDEDNFDYLEDEED